MKKLGIMYRLKPNYVGTIGAIFSFISLAFPWWMVNTTFLGTPSSTISWYVSGIAVSNVIGNPLQPILWAGYTALALVTLGGVLGMAGSLMRRGSCRMPPLLAAGCLNILALAVFVIGFSSFPGWRTSAGEILPGNFRAIFYYYSSGPPPLGCFGSLLNCEGFIVTISSSLSVGYWLALVSGILLFLSQAARVSIGHKATGVLRPSEVGKERLAQVLRNWTGMV